MAIQTYAFAQDYGLPVDPTKRTITTIDEFDRFTRFLSGKPLVFDYETSGLDYFANAQAVGIGLGSWDSSGKLWTAYVPFRQVATGPQLTLDAVGPAIKELLEGPTLKIAHNIKFEDHFSRREGWRVNGPRFDSMVATRLLDENSFADLENCAARDLGLGDEAYAGKRLLQRVLRDLAAQRRLGINDYRAKYGYSEIPIPVIGYYGCCDITSTALLAQKYEAAGVRSNFPRIWQTEMRLTEVLADLEENGLLVDKPYLERLRAGLVEKQAVLLDQITNAVGQAKFNPASDGQLRRLMIDRLRLTWDQLTEAGRTAQITGAVFDPYSHLAVDSSVLGFFAEKIPLLAKIMEWREAEKTITTYTQSIVDKLDSGGFLHGDMQSVGTNTGRLSCRNPNFQNFPAGPQIRSAFVIRGPGWCRLFFDYSQIELRVLAWYSGDPLMVETFLAGGDIHETTRQQVSAMVGHEIPRRVAKMINFGLSYGLTDLGLSKQAGIPQDEARVFLEKFFERFAGIVRYREALCAQARRTGCEWRNVFGRARRVADLASPTPYRRRRAERQLIGSAIQGTAAELTKESLVRIADYIKNNCLGDGVKIVNTVHDEIQLDVRVELVPTVAPAIKQLMEFFPEFSPVPIVVDGDFTLTNWGEKKPIWPKES